MSPASRTPEGFPSKCVLCGVEVDLDFSDTGDDAPCPSCGCLLHRSAMLTDHLMRLLWEPLGVSHGQVTPHTELKSLGSDSLDIIEMIMEMEEEFDIEIPQEAAERCSSVADLVREILRSGGFRRRET